MKPRAPVIQTWVIWNSSGLTADDRDEATRSSIESRSDGQTAVEQRFRLQQRGEQPASEWHHCRLGYECLAQRFAGVRRVVDDRIECAQHLVYSKTRCAQCPEVLIESEGVLTTIKTVQCV